MYFIDKYLFTFFLLLITLSGAAQNAAKSVKTRDIQQDGAKLIINYNIPYDDMAVKYNRNFTFEIESIFVYANGTKIEARSISGDIGDLNSGTPYSIIWDLSKDVRMLSDLKEAELNFKYDQRTLKVIDEINQEINKQGAIEDKKEARQAKRNFRRFDKPINWAFLVNVGIGNYYLNNSNFIEPASQSEEISTYFGYGIQVDFRLEEGYGSYFQLEANYFESEKALNLPGLLPDSEERLKLYAKFKFGEIQIGALGGYILSDVDNSARSKFSYGGMIGWENHPTSIFLIGFGAEVEFEPSFSTFSELYWIKAFGRVGFRF